MSVEGILALMEGMARNKVGLLELDTLKLQLAPPERQVAAMPTAASGIALPARPQEMPQVTAQDAQKAVQAARIQAVKNAEEKLALAQTKTARARRKAAGGIGAGTGSLVDGVFKEALKTKPPTPPESAPVPSGS